MRKFFVKNENVSGNIAKIVGEDVKHMKNVLRLLQNDIIIVCDEDGKNYEARITSIDKEEIQTLILSELGNTTEPDINITVFQCLPKSLEEITSKSDYHLNHQGFLLLWLIGYKSIEFYCQKKQAN
jgi:RsmE family RNA methyltransferase